MAVELPAIVVSLDYRLAPEHRLPAAYDDAVEALSWVWDQAKGGGDPWIINHGDFSRCYFMGSSSGGNMAYHAGIRAMDLDLHPIVLAGVILNQPYLGGEKRTSSEMASEEDPVLSFRLPRCLILGFDGDPLIDRQREFASVLKEGGVSVVARVGGEGFHAAELFVPAKAAALIGEVRQFISDGYVDDGDAA